MKLTQEGLRKLVAEHLGFDEDSVTPEKYFIDDLGADALDVVELLMDVEKTFEIYIPQIDAERLATFGALYEYLKSKAGK